MYVGVSLLFFGDAKINGYEWEKVRSFAYYNYDHAEPDKPGTINQIAVILQNG